MGTPAQVALIGKSQPYLDVRAAVLQHFWLIQTIDLDQDEMPIFEDGLVVVCASFTAEEQQSLIDRVRHAMPQLLIVRVDEFETRPLAGADAVVDDGQGPGALVSAIYELLVERGLESREWPALPEGGWVQ